MVHSTAVMATSVICVGGISDTSSFEMLLDMMFGSTSMEINVMKQGHSWL